MKNMLVLALLLASTAAYADNSVATPATPPGQSAGAPGQEKGERLEQVKQRILAKLQEKQACVQAAQTREALRACMPHRGEGRGEGGGRFGHGGGFGGGNGNGNGGGNQEAPAQ